MHERTPLTLCPVIGTANSRLWNEYIARYHDLGYTPMAGRQMRYVVLAGERLLALLASAPAHGNSPPAIASSAGQTTAVGKIYT